MKSLSTSLYRSYLLTVLKIFTFWFLILWMYRLAFIIFFHDRFNEQAGSEILSTFLHGFRMDVSMTCYLCIIPMIILMIQQPVRASFYKSFLFAYSIIILIIAGFISVFDMGIYRDWHTHLNYRAINYLQYANEASSFSDSRVNFLLALVLVLEILSGFILMILFFRKSQFRFAWNRKSFARGFLFHALLIPILFLGIRGGVQLIPLNESSAYFSSQPILNDAAVNVLWNAGKKFSADKKSLHANPYSFFPDDKAKAIVEDLYRTPEDTFTSILTNNRPNIIIVILESFTADVVGALGGEKNVTPNLDSIIRNGILFTNIYSQGYRTDQGLAALFSGFPSTPDFSIVMQPDKYPKLSFLPEELAEAGYHNSFYYGGELNFANMKAYLLSSGISDLHDKSSYAQNEMNAKWGAHDEFVFNKHFNEISSKKQPFFSVILTLSSHEPFEVPIASEFPGNNIGDKFKSCCYYTDNCIGEYLINASTTSWYNNTLFVFVADHGHILPCNRQPWEPGRFHIPLIFYGEVLKPEFRGKKFTGPGMQCDLPATLLSQLLLSYEPFYWSNNLLNPDRKNFSYYSFDAGFGFMKDDDFFLYNSIDRKTQVTGKPETEETGKAFMQQLFSEYISF